MRRNKREENKYINSLWNVVQTILLSCLLIGIVISATGITSDILFKKYGEEMEKTEEMSMAVSIGEVVTAAVAAVVIIFQLKQEQGIQEKQRKTEEAQFILEYNRSFIENSELCRIEHYLEEKITGDSSKEIKNLYEERQAIINYLVYLSGIASCVHGKNLEIKYIDNLFAYRFFIAMNNPEVQKLELVSYAVFYRGCYQLYEDWTRYRRKSGKYHGDIEIPLMETSLDKSREYEKYLEYPVNILEKDEKIRKPFWLRYKERKKSLGDKEKIFAVRGGRIAGGIYYSEDTAFRIEGIIVKIGADKKLIRSALLKSILYHPSNKKVNIFIDDAELKNLLSELEIAKRLIENEVKESV